MPSELGERQSPLRERRGQSSTCGWGRLAEQPRDYQEGTRGRILGAGGCRLPRLVDFQVGSKSAHKEHLIQEFIPKTSMAPQPRRLAAPILVSVHRKPWSYSCCYPLVLGEAARGALLGVSGCPGQAHASGAGSPVSQDTPRDTQCWGR
ncbi:hypothetical protein KIL84_011930 [Mauremys mutica]|uniref:Uncharacterized protein n=1 Tax=Mauremys mutica TaxID=74926 RepID=A0A9D4B1I9_9SAUR|nr:hypothetical protein KIL84_011930 [Mauremys mutica]